MVEQLPPIIIARRDHARLERLADDALRERHPVGRFLMSEIRRAVVFDTNKVPEGVARLNEWVTYRVDGSRQSESKILVCPDELRNGQIELSVLSPLGAAASRNEHWAAYQILQYRGWTSLRYCRGCRRAGGCALAFSAEELAARPIGLPTALAGPMTTVLRQLENECCWKRARSLDKHYGAGNASRRNNRNETANCH